jgi:hypothetical protein
LQVFEVELKQQGRSYVRELLTVMSLAVWGNTDKAVHDPVEYLSPEVIRPVGIRDEELVELKLRKRSAHWPLLWRFRLRLRTCDACDYRSQGSRPCW